MKLINELINLDSADTLHVIATLKNQAIREALDDSDHLLQRNGHSTSHGRQGFSRLDIHNKALICTARIYRYSGIQRVFFQVGFCKLKLSEVPTFIETGKLPA